MFTFKGQTNVEKQVYASEENFLGLAPSNYRAIKIDGKDGEELIHLNYLNFHSTLKDVVFLGDVSDSLKWLSGTETLEFNGKVTKIRFLEPYGVRNYKKPFSIPFIRNPFWYEKNEVFTIVTTSVMNNGTVPIQPIIKLTKGTDDVVEITVNGTTFEYDFDGEDEVIIDCKEMTVFYQGLHRNKQLVIGFDFPILDVGANDVVIDGDCLVEMKRRSAWL